MAIEVIKPGLATTIQDAGRPGYYNIGIPLSGALDQYALRVANLLVGNEESAAVLEATLLAPELVFRAPAEAHPGDISNPWTIAFEIIRLRAAGRLREADHGRKNLRSSPQRWGPGCSPLDPRFRGDERY